MSCSWVRGALLATLVAAPGCPDDPAPGDDDGSTGDGGATDDTTTATIPATGSSGDTAMVDTTAASSEDGSSDADDDTTTTGSPSGEGRMRLLLGSGGRLGQGFDLLSVVEYDAGVVDSSAVHEPLAAGRVIGNWGLSPALGRVFYRTAASDGTDDHRGFIASYDDGQTGDPVRFDVAPAPDPALGANPVFTEDESALVFFSVDNGAGDNPGLWIVDISGDTPGAPALLHPTVGVGDDVHSDVAMGPGDSGVAFAGDFTGGGLNNLHLASSDPADAGAVTVLSQHDSPEQGVAFSSIQWVPNGSGIVYRADADIDELDELWWVGVAGVPTSPVKINDPLSPDEGLLAIRVSPDSTKVAYWAGQGGLGEVYVSEIDGATPTAPIVVSTPTANAAFANSLRWSASGDALIYTAEHDTVGNRDAYYVDMSGAMPGVPERINGELLADSQVLSVVFGPNAGELFYVAPQNMAGAELFVVDVVGGSPGVPERISGELVDGGSLTGEIIFAPDGNSLLYTAYQDSSAQQELYLLDLRGERGRTTKVNDELRAGFDVQFASRFSDDGTVIAYRIRNQAGDSFPLLLEDLTDGLPNPIVASDAVQGYAVLPTR